MKRQVILFALIALLGVIYPALPSLAQPIRIPHEDPATAAESFNPVAFMLSYNRIVTLASDREYADAQKMLNEVKHADIPPEVQYVIDRYNSLYQRLIDTIAKLRPLPEVVSELLYNGQVQQAKQMLDDAEADIRDARTLSDEIEAVTYMMSNQLGISAGPASSLTGQAYSRLEDGMNRLNQLLDDLLSLWDSLSERYVELAGLTPTELSLSVTPALAFVGDVIKVSGRLTGGGPLAGREIILSTDNKTIVTAADGSYQTNITIPYTYSDNMTIMATYYPPGDDRDRYLASLSQPAKVTTKFHKTRLEVAIPDIFHPGQPFTISGQVSPAGGDSGRTIKVLLDDAPVAEAAVTGRFSLETTPPEQTSVDTHQLTVAIAPKGRYAGAAETQNISISKVPLYIDLQVPKIAVLPKTASISGYVHDGSGPVADSPITIYLKDKAVTTRTGRDGGFAASVAVPLDLFAAVGRTLTVTAKPTEPWQASALVEKRFFSINPFMLELMVFALLAVWIIAGISGHTRRPAVPAAAPPPEMTVIPAVTPAPRLRPRPRPIGIKGRIASAYRGALEAVEGVTGTSMIPSVTLREFLTLAALPTPTANAWFAELTALAETALYSDASPREDAAARAEHLATAINEELNRGTT